MQAEIAAFPKQFNYGVRLTVGAQSFDFAYEGTEDECTWYACMVRLGLTRAGAVVKE